MKQKALTLIEMTVVVAIIALLAVVGIPAIKALYNSFEAGSCSKTIINSALNYAKSTAQKKRYYAGVLFEQKDSVQWATPIIQDPNMKHWEDLDEKTILFIEEKGEWHSRNLGKGSAIAPVYFIDKIRNVSMDKPAVVVFSPSGKLVRKTVAIYPAIDEHLSVRAFVIYDTSNWNKIKGTVGEKDFIDTLKTLFINTYIGNIIE